MRCLYSLMLCLMLLAGAVSAKTSNTHGGSSPYDENKARDGDMWPPFIVSGCNPSVPSSSLTFGSFACKGYVSNGDEGLVYVDQDARAVGPLNLGNGTYWLAIHK